MRTPTMKYTHRAFVQKSQKDSTSFGSLLPDKSTRQENKAQPKSQTSTTEFSSGLNVHREKKFVNCFAQGWVKTLKPRAQLKSSYNSVGTCS